MAALASGVVMVFSKGSERAMYREGSFEGVFRKDRSERCIERDRLKVTFATECSGFSKPSYLEAMAYKREGTSETEGSINREFLL
jgi:hypothetical protein